MKRIHHLMIVAVVLIATTVYAQRRANELPAVPKAYADVLEKVERLENQVARLEAEVRALRSRRNIITTPAVPAIPSQPLPPGWREGEYRGMKYYIVPCDDKAAAPTTQPVR
jgi:hypothetical protein